jgi:hypothetical protein
LRIVGVDKVEDLTRSPKAEALLLTRLQHVPDPAEVHQAFAGATAAPGTSGEVIGYRIYLSDPAPVARAGVCRNEA